MHSPTTPVGPEGLDLSTNDATVPGLDEIIAILALGLERALAARQPCPVGEGKSAGSEPAAERARLPLPSAGTRASIGNGQTQGETP